MEIFVLGCLAYLDLLGSALPVGKDEIVESDLTAQQVGHVHLVGVQRTEQDLKIIGSLL